MASSVAPSLNQLPLEILHRIFYHLDDILRIRSRVSWRRSAMAGRYGVMRIATQSSFVLRARSSRNQYETWKIPSSPVQLVASTEIFVVLTEALLKWKDRRARCVRYSTRAREIQYTGARPHANLVFGRLLLVAFREEVRCYDLNVDAFDSNSGASIIHRAVGGNLRSFRCISAFDVESRPFACAILSETTEWVTQISVYLINVGEESEVTLDLLYQFGRSVLDIQAVDLGPRVITIQCLGPNHDDLIALDVHTRTKLTPLIHVPWHSETVRLPELSPVKNLTSPISILTLTHLLFATSFYASCDGWSTFLQAFTLLPPHDRSHPSALLSPFHSGCIQGIDMCDSCSVATLRSFLDEVVPV